MWSTKLEHKERENFSRVMDKGVGFVTWTTEEECDIPLLIREEREYRVWEMKNGGRLSSFDLFKWGKLVFSLTITE